MWIVVALIGATLLLLILTLPAFSKRWHGLVVFIPVVNALADTTTNFFPPSGINPGNARAFFILVFLLYCAGHLTYKRSGKWVIALSLYLFVMVLFSTDVTYSFQIYLKVFLSVMMFPLGLALIDDLERFRKLNTAMAVSMILIGGQIFLAQQLKLGESIYAVDTLYMGGGLVQLSYVLVLGVLITPLALQLYRTQSSKLLMSVAVFVGLVGILLILRRTSYLALLVGFVVFAFNYQKTKAAMYALVALVLLAVTYPIYAPVLIPRVEARFSSDRDFSEEGRVVEVQVVSQDLAEDFPWKLLLGTELFNSGDYFRMNAGKYPQYLGYASYGRQLHIDYAILLHGAGLLGLVLYLIMHSSLGYSFMSYTKRISPLLRDRYGTGVGVLKATFWALLISSLVISISGSLDYLGLRTSLFLYLGACTRMMTRFGELDPYNAD